MKISSFTVLCENCSTFGQPHASQLVKQVLQWWHAFYMLTRFSSRHLNNAIRDLDYVFVDQDANQSKKGVNSVAILIYYQRHVCHDNLVKTPPKCQTNRLCCFNCVSMELQQMFAHSLKLTYITPTPKILACWKLKTKGLRW